MSKKSKKNRRFFVGFLTGLLVGMLGMIVYSYLLSQYFANLF
jgi:hypothetical protein